MILHANCKINLGLDVLRRREDGYHELSTVMFPVRGLYDVVGVTRTAVPGVRFLSEGLAVDCAPGENICVKAFQLMRERYGVRLAEAELVALAAELGSDTAFFVRNTPQLCTGRGEIMEPYPLCLAGMTLVVVKPYVGVSTREAYAGVRPHVPEVPLAERLRRPVVEWQGLVTNDFEPHIFAAHPAIREARDSLLAAGAVYASMSGSGSAVFGLFDDAQKAGSLRLQTPFVYML